MNKLSLILVGCLIMMCCHAQNSLSLNDAIQKALNNRKDIKIQQTNVQISENEVKKVNSRNLPQITSDLDVRYNTQLQTNVIPGSAFGTVGSPDRKVKFGTDFNTLWGFNLTQNIFNPTNLGDKRIAKAQIEHDQLNINKTETDVKQEVTEAYFTALLWNEKAKLSASNLERTNSILTTAKDQLKQGAITNYDLQHYRIDNENAAAEHEKNKNNQALALNDLWYKVGEDSVATVSLSDSITSLYVQYKQLGELNTNDIKRTELEQEKWQFNIYQLNYKKQNLSYIPSVNFYANYSVQNLSNNFSVFNSNYWYPFNYVGLKVSIPIFDGLLKKYTKHEYALRSNASKLTYDKLVDDYKQEARNAATTLKNALSDLEYQQKNLQLASDLYTIDKDRLKHGAIKPNDLTTTYYTLQQTQTNYLNTVYNYLLAVVKYKKAIGVL